MKIIFMGTPDFAATSLKGLINKGYNIPLVITQPDKEKGRGKKIQMCEVKELALENNLEVFQPKRVKSQEAVEYIKTFEPDLIVVVAYGQILSKEILDIPKLGCINVHGSLLPKYRGAAPIHWAIINGEEKTGVTTMYMSEGLDTGDMILKKEVSINENDTTGDLYPIIADLGAKALVETIENIEKGNIYREKQNDDLSSYAPILKKEDGQIDFNKTSIEIRNKVRGLNPWPCCYTKLNGDMFKILECEIYKTFPHGNNGEIMEVNKENFAIKTNDGSILVTKLQKQGKKPMDTKSFLLGHNINLGDKFL